MSAVTGQAQGSVPSVTEVGGAERGDHAGPVERGADVDPVDPGVRDRAADDRHVHQARQLDVVGPPGAAGDQPPVLLALERPADVPGGVRLVDRLWVLFDLLGDEAGVEFLGHAVTSALFSAAWRTARTMFW